MLFKLHLGMLSRSRRVAVLAVCVLAACLLPLPALPDMPFGDTETGPSGAAETGDADAALQRCKALCREIEPIRCMAFTGEVPAMAQTSAEFRDYVRKNLRGQFGSGGAEGYVRAMVKLGALEKPIDLEAVTVTLMESQAAAYYDPEKHTYFLLMTNAASEMLDMVSAHELCHALQDQHFDLDAFAPSDKQLQTYDSDHLVARQSVLEGEATLVMTLWALGRSAPGSDTVSLDRMAGLALDVQRSMDLDDIISLAETQAQMLGSGSAQMAAAAKELHTMPRFLVETLMSVYVDGAAMVKDVKARRGWAGVSQLYRNPPESTEQVLHPEKIGGGDPPLEVLLPGLTNALPKGWALVEEDVVGELGLRCLFNVWRDRATDTGVAAAAAAAGWGGDKVAYFENSGTGKDLLVWKTVWDTPADAGEFALALRMMLLKRFPGMRKTGRSEPGTAMPYQVWHLGGDRFLKLCRKDSTVGLIDTTDRDMIRVLWE